MNIARHLIFLLVTLLLSCPSASIGNEANRVLYLMQTGHAGAAFEQYHQIATANGEHDYDLIQQMGLTLLEQGCKSCDDEIQMLTLFGAGISANEKAQHILEDAIKNKDPKFQLVALNLLSRFPNDDATDAIVHAMSSNFLPIRLEAAFYLAEIKHPKARGHIESLMQKVPPEIHQVFPQLFAMIGDANSIKALQRLLIHPIDEVRLEAIKNVAKYGRDDLLPDIRKLSKHHNIAQQEISAVALGVLKDEASAPHLQVLANSPSPSVRLAAMQALYRLGREDIRLEVEKLAKEQDLFAIAMLADMPGSEPVLHKLVKSHNVHVRINSALSLLELSDPKCLPALCDILIKDPRDLAFIRSYTYGRGLSAWKAIPSARQNLSDTPVAFELSLNMRELALAKALELPEGAFLSLAHTIFQSQQNDLVPLLASLLENLQTPSTIELLKRHREKIGAPLIRNYCNLILYRLKEEGPYSESLTDFVSSLHHYNLIQFRPFIPWELREKEPSQFQLTPEDTSRLLVESFESIVQADDDAGIDILLHAIKHGNKKNKFALAGLLIRATN